MTEENQEIVEEQISDEEQHSGSDVDHSDELGQELDEATRLLSDSPTAREAQAWKLARDIVECVRPVPVVMRNFIRPVYGRSDTLGNVSPYAFLPVSGLLKKAVMDTSFSDERRIVAPGVEESSLTLSVCLEVLGFDVAAALALVHSVCRRINTTLPPRVSRALIDDALLRTRIGLYVGKYSQFLFPGQGMLIGFCGRAGLAIQIASGSTEQAEKALSSLASGREISNTCRRVYGCDPLQVAVMTLIAGGCHRNIAMGIASYSKDSNAEKETERNIWVSGFRIIDSLRVGDFERLQDLDWDVLGFFDQVMQDQLFKDVQNMQRKGHGWRWVTNSFISAGPPREPKRKIRTLSDEEFDEEI